MQSSTPRPRSPHMNNEEPINLAHYPDAIKPRPDSVPPIERDDFPAPPFPYTDPGMDKHIQILLFGVQIELILWNAYVDERHISCVLSVFVNCLFVSVDA